MKLTFSKREKYPTYNSGMSNRYVNIYAKDTADNDLLIGRIYKERNEVTNVTYWMFGKNLRNILPNLPTLHSFPDLDKAKAKAQACAERLNARQIEVRVLGHERYLDEAPESGLEDITTSALLAEVLNRVKKAHYLGLEEGRVTLTDIKKAAAETPNPT